MRSAESQSSLLGLVSQPRRVTLGAEQELEPDQNQHCDQVSHLWEFSRCRDSRDLPLSRKWPYAIFHVRPAEK